MNPTLYVLSGPQVGDTFELQDGSVLGRAPTCDAGLAVALRESSVSRNHARVTRDGETWYVEDLKSSNGTIFDGKRIQRQALSDQTEFRLGELELRVRFQAKAAPLAPKQKVVIAEPEPPAPPAEPEDDFGEIELEEEIELEDESAFEAPPPPPPPKPASPPPPRSAPPRDLAKTKLSSAPASGEPVAKRKVLQYNRVENRSGLFATDMAQWPIWVQALMVLFALGVFAGLCYGAYFATQLMRQ